MNSNFNSLPKVELHVHLDCCLSYKALKRINPKISYDDFQTQFIGTSCSCLKDYIKCADRALEYMQTKEYPTSNTNKKESPVYTGTLVKGIATMHKSNAVPVISQQEAEDISNMRRN